MNSLPPHFLLVAVVAGTLFVAGCDGSGVASGGDDVPADVALAGPQPAVPALARSGEARGKGRGHLRCSVSSPNPGALPARRYRFDSVKLRFPADVLDAAGGRTRLVRLRFGRESPGESDLTVVREAECLIPDTDHAMDLVIEALAGARVGRPGDWRGARMAGPGRRATASLAVPSRPLASFMLSVSPLATLSCLPLANLVLASASACYWEWVEYEYCSSYSWGPCSDWQTGWRQEYVCDGGGGGGDPDCEVDPGQPGCGPYGPGVIVLDPKDAENPPPSGDPDGPDDPEPCDTGDPVIDAPGFATGAQLMRDASNMDVSRYQDRQETFGMAVPDGLGGWLVQPFLQDDQYAFRTWDRASPKVPHASTLAPGAVPIHTHPFRDGEGYKSSKDGLSRQYKSGPGPADGLMLAALGYARGFVIDEEKIYVFDLTGAVTAEYDRCGY